MALLRSAPGVLTQAWVLNSKGITPQGVSAFVDCVESTGVGTPQLDGDGTIIHTTLGLFRDDKL